MHVPDGFLDVPTSLGTGAVAAAGVALALRNSRRELDERTTPMAGLAATFIFAAQMVNFPVGAGTSGHLLGGPLAAALVGPWTGILCLSVVLVVQCLLFADGGITALGTNITLMGLVGVGTAAVVIRLVRWAMPARPSSAATAAAAGAMLSVLATALAFTALFSVGGVAPVPIADVATAMLGWHLLIGLGEAAITATVVASIAATRPDLVYAARIPGAASRPETARAKAIA
jgi:cobalt/nickel transport system permease protein